MNQIDIFRTLFKLIAHFALNHSSIELLWFENALSNGSKEVGRYIVSVN